MSTPVIISWLALDNISVCYSHKYVRNVFRSKGIGLVMEVREAYSDDVLLMETEPEYWYKQCTQCLLLMVKWYDPESADRFALNGNKLDIDLECKHLDIPVIWHLTAGDKDTFQEMHGDKTIFAFNFGIFNRRTLQKHDMDITDDANWPYDELYHDPCYKYDVDDDDQRRLEWFYNRDSESTLEDQCDEEEEEDYFDD